MSDRDELDRASAGTACHVCSEPALHFIRGFESFRRVTSDCKPWPEGARLCVCRACGCVQKALDERWQAESAEIYDAYEIYHQSDGAEQASFEADTGRCDARSVRLVDRLCEKIALPATGRLLDVGCGNGALLGAWSDALPGWTLTGTELSEQHRVRVEAIARVEGLHTGRLDELAGRFDAASLVHVLEHIPHPSDVLGALREKLAPGGLLIIEVPDYGQVPFDLLVADHVSHFSLSTLGRLIEGSGFEIVAAARDWMPKELTVVARKRAVRAPQSGAPDWKTELVVVERCGEWLRALVERARSLGDRERLGIFGTAIGGTWLFGELGGAVDLFVDEDPSRVGRSHLGRKIYHPAHVPEGSDVLIALPDAFASVVRDRLEREHASFRSHVPAAVTRRAAS